MTAPRIKKDIEMQSAVSDMYNNRCSMRIWISSIHKRRGINRGKTKSQTTQVKSMLYISPE